MLCTQASVVRLAYLSTEKLEEPTCISLGEVACYNWETSGVLSAQERGYVEKYLDREQGSHTG